MADALKKILIEPRRMDFYLEKRARNLKKIKNKKKSKFLEYIILAKQKVFLSFSSQSVWLLQKFCGQSDYKFQVPYH